MKASINKSEVVKTKGLLFKKNITKYEVSFSVELDDEEIRTIEKHNLKSLKLFEGCTGEDLFSEENDIVFFNRGNNGDYNGGWFNLNMVISDIKDCKKKKKPEQVSITKFTLDSVGTVAFAERCFVESMKKIKSIVHGHMEYGGELSAAGEAGITTELDL